MHEPQPETEPAPAPQPETETEREPEREPLQPCEWGRTEWNALDRPFGVHKGARYREERPEYLRYQPWTDLWRTICSFFRLRR